MPEPAVLEPEAPEPELPEPEVPEPDVLEPVEAVWLEVSVRWSVGRLGSAGALEVLPEELLDGSEVLAGVLAGALLGAGSFGLPKLGRLGSAGGAWALESDAGADVEGACAEDGFEVCWADVCCALEPIARVRSAARPK